MDRPLSPFATVAEVLPESPREPFVAPLPPQGVQDALVWGYGPIDPAQVSRQLTEQGPLGYVFDARAVPEEMREAELEAVEAGLLRQGLPADVRPREIAMRMWLRGHYALEETVTPQVTVESATGNLLHRDEIHPSVRHYSDAELQEHILEVWHVQLHNDLERLEEATQDGAQALLLPVRSSDAMWAQLPTDPFVAGSADLAVQDHLFGKLEDGTVRIYNALDAF